MFNIQQNVSDFLRGIIPCLTLVWPVRWFLWFWPRQQLYLEEREVCLSCLSCFSPESRPQNSSSCLRLPEPQPGSSSSPLSHSKNGVTCSKLLARQSSWLTWWAWASSSWPADLNFSPSDLSSLISFSGPFVGGNPSKTLRCDQRSRSILRSDDCSHYNIMYTECNVQCEASSLLWRCEKVEPV